jgi:carboxylesterase 2
MSDCTLKYGNLSDTYFKLYPANNNASTADRSWNAAARDTSLVGDYLFGLEWPKSAPSPFYTYYWTHAPPGQNQSAFYQPEIMYVLNALYANDAKYPFTAEDFYIQELMSGYWANFAKTGNPNEGGSCRFELPYWGPNNGSQTVMELGNKFGAMPIAGKEEISLIEAYFAQQSPY